jgi:N-carbamoylputrescine amidase
MPRIVRCSIIQASNAVPATEPLPTQKKAMVEKHVGLIRQAAKEGAQIVCLQEIFNGPYFCAEQADAVACEGTSDRHRSARV